MGRLYNLGRLYKIQTLRGAQNAIRHENDNICLVNNILMYRILYVTEQKVGEAYTCNCSGSMNANMNNML